MHAIPGLLVNPDFSDNPCKLFYHIILTSAILGMQISCDFIIMKSKEGAKTLGTNTSGKRDHQKLKPYIILQILQRETDENHVMSAVEIDAAPSALRHGTPQHLQQY